MPLSVITGGTNIGDMTAGAGLAAAFDGDVTEVDNDCAVREANNAFVGKTLAGPAKFGRATIYGSSDSGFSDGGNTITINIRAKQGAAPSGRTNGTVVGTKIFTDPQSGAGQVIDSTDLITEWDHLWADISGGVDFLRVAELTLERSYPANAIVSLLI